VKLTEKEKNRKLNDLLDALEFNQVRSVCDVGSLSKVKKLPNYLYFGTVVESDMKGFFHFLLTFQHKFMVVHPSLTIKSSTPSFKIAAVENLR